MERCQYETLVTPAHLKGIWIAVVVSKGDNLYCVDFFAGVEGGWDNWALSNAQS